MGSITDYKFSGSVPENYDRYLGPIMFEPYALDLIARLKDKNFTNILELACGTGRVTNHLLSILTEESALTASDLNPDMIAVAKRKINSNKVNWQVVNAQEMPFERESFDLVVCQFGVMFFPDKPAAFAGIYNVIKQGGKFLFNTWDNLDFNFLNKIIDSVLKDMLKEKSPDFLEKGPFSFYDKKLIREMLTEAGFNNISVDVVPKQLIVSDVENIVKGFTTGSPLAAYLMEQEAEIRNEICDKLKTKIIKEYGETNINISLQAIICSGEKI
ncbi:methyltransferase domain-containing protein [soil metagenome]